MKTLTILLLQIALATTAGAQDANWRGTFYNKEYNIHAKLNLNAMDIPVPGLELDSCYGYFTGNINGAWYVLRIKEKKGSKALVRAISERGADAQDVEITLTDDGISLKLVDGTYLKGVDKNKYVKLPKPLEMLRE